MCLLESDRAKNNPLRNSYPVACSPAVKVEIGEQPSSRLVNGPCGMKSCFLVSARLHQIPSGNLT